jgi:Ca2+-binding RTX toxin-like protein
MLIEDAGQGNDTVIASASYALKAGISVEILSAQQGGAAISLTGNELNNVITGNAGNNVLDGSVGADMLSGGAGDDTYMVDNALDVVTEAAGQGTDTIVTSINLALTSGSGVEALTAAVGALAINLTGNEGANTLKGNDGNNVLNGGLGKDVLSGGGGADIFVFDKKANKKTNLDRITDYDVQSDSIYLESNFFKKIGKGTFVKPRKVKKDFFSLKGHKDKDDYLAYSRKTGDLTYDADGSGKKYKPVVIAGIDKDGKALPTLSAAEFFVI